MQSSATIVAEPGEPAGTTRCTTLRSSPPFAFRQTDDGLYQVASAAGPLGGDELALDVRLTADADLTVRGVAAQLVHPGPHRMSSSTVTRVSVGDRASLRWLPAPIIVIDGADHRTTTTIDLAVDASIVWREIVVLGRHDEAPGSLRQHLRVTRVGRVLLHTDLALGPRWPGASGPAGTAGARIVASMLVVGRPAPAIDSAMPAHPVVRAATHPLADDAFLVTALGDAVEPVEALLQKMGAGSGS